MSFARTLPRTASAVAWWHWLPLASATAATWWATANEPAWVAMFAMALAIIAGLKWLAWAQFVSSGGRMSMARALIFLLAWPGMNAAEFASDESPPRPEWWEWPAAIGIAGFGFWLMLGYAPHLVGMSPLLGGAVGMFGFLFGLLFGALWLLALVWRSLGIPASPIMNTPILAGSLADFWGRRWNLAFHDVATVAVFRPVTSTLGSGWAMVATFLFSGLLHDAAISLPARGGYGLPTLYFLIQAAALGIERGRLGRRLGLGHGLIGRIFATVVVLGPLILLFHPAFLTQVIAPMLAGWRAIS